MKYLRLFAGFAQEQQQYITLHNKDCEIEETRQKTVETDTALFRDRMRMYTGYRWTVI